MGILTILNFWNFKIIFQIRIQMWEHCTALSYCLASLVCEATGDLWNKLYVVNRSSLFFSTDQIGLQTIVGKTAIAHIASSIKIRRDKLERGKGRKRNWKGRKRGKGRNWKGRKSGKGRTEKWVMRAKDWDELKTEIFLNQSDKIIRQIH